MPDPATTQSRPANQPLAHTVQVRQSRPATWTAAAATGPSSTTKPAPRSAAPPGIRPAATTAAPWTCPPASSSRARTSARPSAVRPSSFDYPHIRRPEPLSSPPRLQHIRGCQCTHCSCAPFAEHGIAGLRLSVFIFASLRVAMTSNARSMGLHSIQHGCVAVMRHDPFISESHVRIRWILSSLTARLAAACRCMRSKSSRRIEQAGRCRQASIAATQRFAGCQAMPSAVCSIAAQARWDQPFCVLMGAARGSA